MSQAHLDLLKEYFESLTAESVDRLGDFYAQDAYFKDPFNELHSLTEIQRVFRHMFVKLDAPRFEMNRAWLDGDSAVLLWDFIFRFRGKAPQNEQRISGMSLLKFDAAGKVDFHRDYWDPAEGLYEKIPILGGLMRWLKRRAA